MTDNTYNDESHHTPESRDRDARLVGHEVKPDTINLHETLDASVWAAEFCKNWPTAFSQVPGREGVETEEAFEAIMIGWFANAIMAGVDSGSAPVVPKVKPLVWEDSFGVLRAETPFGDYMVSGKILTLPLPMRPDQVHNNAEASKVAAQADHEARILSQIDMAPVTVQEAEKLREALREIERNTGSAAWLSQRKRPHLLRMIGVIRGIARAALKGEQP